MKVIKNSVSGVTVIQLVGTLDSTTSGEVHQAILPVLTERRPVLIDLSEMSHVSDAGLRTMLAIYRQAQAVDGDVALVGLNRELRAVLTATGFLRFFVVADDVAAGLRALAEQHDREQVAA